MARARNQPGITGRDIVYIRPYKLRKPDVTGPVTIYEESLHGSEYTMGVYWNNIGGGYLLSEQTALALAGAVKVLADILNGVTVDPVVTAMAGDMLFSLAVDIQKSTGYKLSPESLLDPPNLQALKKPREETPDATSSSEETKADTSTSDEEASGNEAGSRDTDGIQSEESTGNENASIGESPDRP